MIGYKFKFKLPSFDAAEISKAVRVSVANETRKLDISRMCLITMNRVNCGNVRITY